MAASLESKVSIKANWRCFVACLIILISPFQYGLDFGLIGGLQAMPGFLQIFGYRAANGIGWNLSPLRQQLISSFMTLGAFASAAAAGFAAAKLSRRWCLWLACALCCVSNVLMMASEDIGALYAGRLLIGLANGWFMTFSQLYIQESSPAKYRGLFLIIFQFMTSFVGSAATIFMCLLLISCVALAVWLSGWLADPCKKQRRQGHPDRHRRQLGHR